MINPLFKFTVVRSPNEPSNSCIDKVVDDSFNIDSLTLSGIRSDGRDKLNEVLNKVRNYLPAPLSDNNVVRSSGLYSSTGLYPKSIAKSEHQKSQEISNRNVIRFLNSQTVNDIDKISPEIIQKESLEILKQSSALIKQNMEQFNKPNLINSIDKLICDSTNFPDLVSWISSEHNNLKSKLFLNLYTQYIRKRKHEINLEENLNQLRILNTLYWLGRDCSITAINSPANTFWFWLKNFFISTFNGLNKRETSFPLKEPSPIVIENSCLPECEKAIPDKKHLAMALSAKVIVHPIFAQLYFYNVPFNPIKSIGIGDLKIVKETLCEYALSEIGHIENILKGESKNRVHRKLNSFDSFTSLQRENLNEKETEFTTTERFEMNKEIQDTIDRSTQFSTNVTLNYNGPVVVTNSTNFASNTNSNNSLSISNNYAKDIVDRTREKVVKKVNQLNQQRKKIEVEDTNSHGFNNEKGSNHITGIYRFVDKHYQSQIFKYGSRMMFEFIVPDPAFFYRFATDWTDSFPEDRPSPPEVFDLILGDINSQTIDDYSTLYNLSEAPPLPPIELSNWEVYSGDFASQQEGIFQIPDGYYLDELEVNGHFFSSDSDDGYFMINFPGTFDGRITHNDADDSNGDIDVDDPYVEWGQGQVEWDDERFDVTAKYTNIGLQGSQYKGSVISDSQKDFAFRILATFKRTDQLLFNWQRDIYRLVRQQYDDKYKQYLADLADYEIRKQNFEAQSNKIKTENPLILNNIIREELRKHCISMIAKEFDTDMSDDLLTNWNAIDDRDNNVLENIDESGSIQQVPFPAINLTDAKPEGNIVQFLEQAFEWDKISWFFYPYFWKEESKWMDNFKYYSEVDYKFGEFLRAGYARVLVPVYLTYNDAIIHYLNTREPWNGGDAPVIGDPLYIALHDELKDEQDDIENAVPEGQPWTYTVPTPLVYLQKDSQLPNYK